MPDQRVAAESDSAVPLDEIVRRGVREKPDVSAIAAVGKNEVCVLVWHYHDDDIEGPDADVTISLDGLPDTVQHALLNHFRIDANHSNAFTVWKKMGSPHSPTSEQFAKLDKAGKLAELEPQSVSADHGKLTVHMSLPRQAVSLLVLDYAPAH